MLIKQSALIPHLNKTIKAIYIIVGNDHYLINDTAYNIKKAWRQRGETSEKILDINTPNDWKLLLNEANSYSLFEELSLIDIRFDKKSIDQIGKEMIQQYLQQINSSCLIILRASAIPIKQLQWLAHHEEIVLVQITPLTGQALQNWIVSQFKNQAIRHDPQVPAVIYQFCQNNMLACSQAIEKLALIYDNENALTQEDAYAQLIDHCEFQLYELADACLSSNTVKAIHLLRLAYSNRTEPTLILWLLTQEMRQLIQLSHLLKQSMGFSNACNELKIWPKRTKLYEMALARHSLPGLYNLLQQSKQLDECIKTSQSPQVWQMLEKLALMLCCATNPQSASLLTG